MEKNIHDFLTEQINSNPVILYMKGTQDRPRCGFSAEATRILKSCGVKFTSVDVLENLDIRAYLPVYSSWSTFPQLYLKGEFIGGCDIMQALYKSGELQAKLAAAGV